MRDAMAEMGGDPKKINPLQPVELVIDHSVQVDRFGSASAFAENATLEFERNEERYAFLKWGQHALDDFRAVPPDTGIVHQVNIEFLGARRLRRGRRRDRCRDDGEALAYPDTVVGTDSHTTMANGLGVLAWGVGGIEAEAAMLGQPVTMLVPDVIGFRLTGKLREGVTATDLVLAVTEMLRKKGVVGKFVEFYGAGLSNLGVADRVTIGNMSPEYGSTCRDLPDRRANAGVPAAHGPSGRADRARRSVRESARHCSAPTTRADPIFTDTLELDLSSVVPNLAGPRRPQDRVALNDVKREFGLALEAWSVARARGANGKAGDDAAARLEGEGGGDGRRRAAAHRTLRRRGRDRGDHVVHEHVQSGRDDRRRSACEKSRRTRPDEQAVGEDEPRARFQSRHRLLAESGRRAVSRRARLQSRRLRLHDVHRQ